VQYITGALLSGWAMASVEFRSVVDAVRCAIEVQTAMVERNAGLHGVNIAARLEGIAHPGSICLSEDAYRQVRSRIDLVISDLGETTLKNIAEPKESMRSRWDLPLLSSL
jgi:adenylate cyclase